MFDFLKIFVPISPAIEGHHKVGNRNIPLRIIKNARANRITLRIEVGGRGLKVTIPHGVKEVDVERFLTRHQQWLEDKIAKYPEDARLHDGMMISVRGVPHLIKHDALKRGSVLQINDETGAFLMVNSDAGSIGRRVADFLKKQAKSDIEPHALELAAACQKKIKSIRFKDTKSRWGSCSSSGNLSFSWRIMMAPPCVILYLVAHEVAHLTHMNHGSDFWNLCEKLCRERGYDMNEAKQWLKKNGALLQMIEF